MILILGIFIPWLIHRFSTKLYTLLFSILDKGSEPVAELMMLVLAK